jgi:hypothetical protein
MDSPVLAYESGATNHITTRGWFCKKGKASLGGVVREFQKLAPHLIEGGSAPDLEFVKEAFRHAKKSIDSNLSGRIAQIEKRISESSTSLIGRIVNFFRNWKKNCYVKIMHELDQIELQVKTKHGENYNRFNCNTPEATKKFLEKNGFSKLSEIDAFTSKFSSLALTFEKNTTLTNPAEIKKLHRAFHEILKGQSGYALTKNKYDLAALLDNTESLISQTNLNKIFHYCINSEFKKIAPEQLIRKLKCDKYLSPQDLERFQSFLSLKPIYLDLNDASVSEKTIADLVHLYTETPETPTVDQVMYPTQFAEFLRNAGAAQSFSAEPIDKVRALQMLNNTYGKSLNPTLKNELADLLVQRGFKTTFYAHLSTEEEVIAMNQAILNLLKNHAAVIHKQLNERLEKPLYITRREALEQKKRANASLLVMQNQAYSTCTSLIPAEIILDILEKFSTPAELPLQMHPRSQPSPASLPPSTFRMWA